MSKILSVFGLAAVLALGFWFALPTADASDKSKKKAVETADAPKAIGPYSQAVVADDFVFLAGQIGIEPKSGKLVEGGIEAETEQVLKNIEAVLKAGKSDFDNVVKTTIFLADINDFAKVNEIYSKYFKSPFPARSTVQVAKLPRDARIEIEVTAMVKSEKMKIAIVIFDKFTDIDLFLMWDLLNRVRIDGWEVKILGEKRAHISATDIEIKTHGTLEEANGADAVLFVSGQGTRDRIADENWLKSFNLNAEKQFIGSICSGSLILAKLGLLEGKTATTYPTAKTTLESFGVETVEKPFIAHGRIATAGGCLAQQYLIGWVIENLANKDWADLVVKAIQPVGEGLFFADAPNLTKLYAPIGKASAKI